MNLTLKDIAQEKQIWTQTKTTELENIFDTQDEIVIDILQFLGLGVRDTSKATVFTSIDKPKELQLILNGLKFKEALVKIFGIKWLIFPISFMKLTLMVQFIIQ